MSPRIFKEKNVKPCVYCIARKSRMARRLSKLIFIKFFWMAND